jgi:peptidoglycan/xylan/chitin deacetylase (PgdA/CDA1 family)
VLSEIGQTELAYTLLLQREFPSWLYSVDQGATTIWERWNGYTKEGGFGDVRMNSFNHYAYGAVVGWLFEHPAGIKPDAVRGGWRHFTLAPEPDERLGRISAKYKTDFGAIESEWEYGNDGAVKYRVVVPPGTTASLQLPGCEVMELSEGEFIKTIPPRKESTPKCIVSYTFDDGLLDQYGLAYPLFREAGLKATFFIIGSKIGNPDGMRSKAESHTPTMTWAQVREMAECGMEIASHGWAHGKYSKMDRTAILDDMRKNQVAIKENAGVECRSFAAPYNAKAGGDGLDVREIAKEAGLHFFRMHQKAAGGKMTAERMNEMVEKAEKNGEWLVFMIHGIARGYDAWENQDELRKHLQWVKEQNDVRVATFAEAASFAASERANLLP